MNKLFITGPYRSGSTLLDKLLHQHPDISVGSQPFPFLYFRAKTKFLDSRNLQRRYPIEHLFLERDYTLNDLNAFLETCRFTRAEVTDLLQAMTDYSGQYTPGFLPHCLQSTSTPSGTFYEVYEQLLVLLSGHLGKAKPVYIGAKESFCDEFAPFLLSKGNKVIVIIRDPRDIVTSLNFGRGGKHGGNVRPTLYHLRQWRKSVSFCVEYESHPDFAWVKYEDLVLRPWPVLDRLTGFLNLPPFQRDAFAQGIFDQQGILWRGNSSFDEYTFISTESIGKFEQRLPENAICYIEATCFPELRALGYAPAFPTDEPDKEMIRDYQEFIPVTHERFPEDYSQAPQHVQEEIQRLDYLQQTHIIDLEQQRLWFIFPRAYWTLRKTLRSHHADE